MVAAGIVLVAILGVAACVAVLSSVLLLRRARRRHSSRPDPQGVPPQDRRLPAVVINPSKFVQLGPIRAQIAGECAAMGWAAPLWLETTVDDPGAGQARQAVEAGADVVLACGGDGTVRQVAQSLAGTGVPIGLLPAGTSNLLARNLHMDLHDIPGATRIALSGDDRAVDVGRVQLDDNGQEQVFLMMAGMGFDAAIMAAAPEALKARVGPFAYFVAGLRSLSGHRTRIALETDGDPVRQLRVRTLVVGNCGRLLGGLVLMPDARIDDGVLDVVSIAPKGIVGWAAVTARVLTRRRKGHRRVEHWQARTITVTADSELPAQLDGDSVGDTHALRIRVDPGALVVRVPAVEQGG
ncbi:MAG: diacylglycerol/lipid kinase family protein [Pseudonocardiaceae bacterium]